MKKILLSFNLLLIVSIANAQVWSKISGITDSTLIYDLANINDKVVVSGTSYNAIFPVVGEYFVSTDGANTWTAASTILYSGAVLDALPINNIFSTYATIGGVQSQKLNGGSWSDFSTKFKFAEFSNGAIIGGSYGLDSVHNISSTGVVGSTINSTKFSFGNNGDYFVGANNRMFLFRNGASGLYGGQFSYIDYNDLSSFKTPLTLDGTAMTAIDWRDLVGITDMTMMTNGDLIATSAEEGLLKSIDNGLNWTRLNTLFGGAGNLVYKNTLGHLYALVGYGAVAFSSDGGITFTNITANLPTESLKSQLFVNSLDEVFVFLNNNSSSGASVDNAGIYKLDGVGAAKNLTALPKFELFPNPNNGVFTFKNHSASLASLSIVNLLGTEVFKINTRNETCKIDISNQAAGIYFVKATISDIIQTQKIVIE